MLRLILFLLVVALIWLEVIPLRKWFYMWKAYAVSSLVRRYIEFRAWLDKLVS